MQFVDTAMLDRNCGSDEYVSFVEGAMTLEVEEASEIASAVLAARFKSDENIRVGMIECEAKCWPRRRAWRTPWFVRGESVVPALRSMVSACSVVPNCILAPIITA